MYHFFVEPQNVFDEWIRITGKDVNHIHNVLRMKPGEEITVSTGLDEKEYHCIIREIDSDVIQCEIAFVKTDGQELSSEIYLFQGLPKADKMEFIIQKAVEIGVKEIIPVETKRCVAQLDAKKAPSRVARWQAIAEAAAKQSKRLIIPQITLPMSYKEALAKASSMDIKLIPYELAESMTKTKELIQSIQPGMKVAIFIGPEGGFEKKEVEEAIQMGIAPITLGKRILRTETAGLVILSWIMYHLEQ